MSDKERNIKIDAQIPMFLLFLLFLGLKLGGVITWSWLWVTAPLWGIPVFIIAVGLLVFAIVIPTIAYEWIRQKIK